MTPAPTTIAHYKIMSMLGEGGMGAVYRATDTRLNRDVAIKVLPSAFAEDASRMQRFEREAQVLASLNHPNIAAIYGIEQGAIVMELVEGGDLKCPVPIDTAIAYARQIAAGLEAAHEKGIIHRDLKPANIKVTPDGTVKLLDFGLAKATESSNTSSNATQSPTLSLAMTQAGMILGTAAYMAPEQARGKPVAKRADIWAFGVVLYETLTGTLLFGGGETVSDSLAAVLTREPDFAALPADTPLRVRRLLERCRQKDPKLRLRDIGEARILLEQPEPAAPAAAAIPATRSRLPWIIAAAFALSSLALGVMWLLRPVPEERAIRFTILAPEKTSFDSATPIVSPDGSRIVFAASSEGKYHLWLRDLDATTARPLPGTEGVRTAASFWSADSCSLGFFIDGKLKRIDISGGSPLTVCDAPLPVAGGTWGRQGTILFEANPNGGLMRVPSAGGKPAPVTELDASRSESVHRWPSFLPDGRHFLYVAASSDREKTAIWVGDLESKSRRLVMTAASNAIYDPRGFLFFVREGTLMAQPFDAGRLETTGDAFPVAEQVDYSRAALLGSFGVSQTGVLAYGTGGLLANQQLAWFDRAGKPLGTVGPPGPLFQPSLSPDGGRVAVDRGDPQAGGIDIWMYDLAHATNSRFTFDPRDDRYPAFSPDGGSVAFISDRTGRPGLYVKSASGTGKEELLFESPDSKGGTNWSRDGKFLVFTTNGVKTNSDIWVLPNPLGEASSRKPYAFVQTEAQEFFGSLSPDGKFMAYTSDESRRSEVYVQSFPGREGKFQISSGGGTRAVWSRDGKELFYVAADQKMMAVDVKTGARFEHGIPKALFEARTITRSPFAVSPDGKRFLLVSPAESGGISLTVVLNWPAGVKK